MISRYAWYLRELLKQVWVRVTGFALLALLSAVLARVLSPFLPEDIALESGSEAVEQLLNVLTTTMLAVTTFSLSIAVAAYAAAASTATPRAAVLLQQDRTTQNVLATFLGAFVFGLVGLIALNANLYDESGRFVIFVVTGLVIGLVVLALIRWIDHLMTFGRMGDTLDRVEAAASDAMRKRLKDPYLGGVRMVAPPAGKTTEILCRATGYVQHIDMQALQEQAESIGARAYLNCLPGTFVTVGDPIIVIGSDTLTDKENDAVCATVSLGKQRTFEEDPRFGLIVLAEIASRALSPAVNDPGTAIDILGRFVRILALWRDRSDPEPLFADIFVAPLTPHEMVEDAFRPIARDGASLVEVQIRLHKSLHSICRTVPDVFVQAANDVSQDAVTRAEAAELVASDLAAIRQNAAKLPRVAQPTRD